MTTHFKTSSGAHYEVNEDQAIVRRLNADSDTTKRADNKWIDLLDITPIEVGKSVRIVMTSLSRFGPDDLGNENGGSTVRVTTPVTEIWEE